MSIRTRLLLSYIAMILVPIFLFFLSVMLMFAVFFRDDFGAKWMPDIHNTITVRDELFNGVKMMADIEPERLTDNVFLNKLDAKFSQVDAGLIVLKNNRVAYASSILGNADWTAVLSQVNNGAKAWSSKVNVDDRSYSFKQYEFLFSDGERGALYMLTDSSNFSEFAGKFIPLLFLSLLIAIGLTNGLLTVIVSRSIIKPLRALKHAAEQIKEGNLEHEAKLHRKDEIGELGNAFEEMRLRLKDSIQIQLQYEENRKELISNISHDLKTPITAIIACAEGMLEGIADTDEKRNNYLQMIYNKATDLNRLIEELFLLSKLDLKKLPFHFERMDATDFLRDLTAELRMFPQNDGIDFEFACLSEDAVTVVADREKLRRVVMNIVENSMKHLKEEAGKQIRLELADGDREATVTIVDNGKGIAKAALPYVFDRFYRAEPSRSGETGGSGLGLAIVKQIVEGHGGTVKAECEYGEGTRISFTLPKAKGGSA